MATVSRDSDSLAVAAWREAGNAESKSDRYLAKRLGEAVADYKGVAVTTFLLATGVGLMLWLSCGVLLEHYLVPGGLPAWIRWTWLVLAVAAVVAAAVRWLLPLVLYRVNLVYAARAIERDNPELHNDIVNAVLVKSRPEESAELVVRSLERRAAKRLAKVPCEGVVDRTPAVRLAAALAVLVALACIYELAAPKSLVVTAVRLVAPWLGLAAPARVRIEPPRLAWRIPGEEGAVEAAGRELPRNGWQATIIRGRQLVVASELQGLRRNEKPLLLVTPVRDDGSVDAAVPAWEIEMARGPRESPRHIAVLPDSVHGLDHSVDLVIVAGDARSERLRVAVVDSPTLLVREVRYDYPEYTRLPDETVAWQGDLRAVEGTLATIVVESNQPLDAAWIDRGGDGKHKLLMRGDPSDLARAKAAVTLKLNPERAGPEFEKYRLLFRPRGATPAQREEVIAEKIEHRIDVLPDLAPEVSIEEPREPSVRVPPDAPVAIRIHALDPDFGLARVGLELRIRGGEQKPPVELFAGDKPGPFRGAAVIVPEKIGAGPGAVIEYRGVAVDARAAGANVTATKWQSLVVDASVHPRPVPNGPDHGDGKPNGNGPAFGNRLGNVGNPNARQQGDDVVPGEGGTDGGAAGGGQGGDDGGGQHRADGNKLESQANDAGKNGVPGGTSGSKRPGDGPQSAGQPASQRNAEPSSERQPQGQPQEGKEQGKAEGSKSQDGQQGRSGKDAGQQQQIGQAGPGSDPQAGGGQGQGDSGAQAAPAKDGSKPKAEQPSGKGGDQKAGEMSRTRRQEGPTDILQTATGKTGDVTQQQQQDQRGSTRQDQVEMGPTKIRQHVEGVVGDVAQQQTQRQPGPSGQEQSAAGKEDTANSSSRDQQANEPAGGERPSKPSVAADGTNDGEAIERILEDRERKAGGQKPGEASEPGGKIEQNQGQKGPTDVEQRVKGRVGDVAQQQEQEQRGGIGQNQVQTSPTQVKQDIELNLGDVNQQQKQDQEVRLKQDQSQSGPTKIDQRSKQEVGDVTQQQVQTQKQPVDQRQRQPGPTDVKQTSQTKDGDVRQQQSEQQREDDKRAQDTKTPGSIGDKQAAVEAKSLKQEKQELKDPALPAQPRDPADASANRQSPADPARESGKPQHGLQQPGENTPAGSGQAQRVQGSQQQPGVRQHQQSQAEQSQGAAGQNQQGQAQQKQGGVDQSQQPQTQDGTAIVSQDQNGQVNRGTSLINQSSSGNGKSQRGGATAPLTPGPVGGQQPQADGVGDWTEQDLAHARNAADLAIEHLRKSLDAGPSDVLDQLGWTADQARAFLDRWEAMKRMAGSSDPRQRVEFEKTVRSLGLRPGGVRNTRDVPADVKGGQAEGRRSRPPSDYRDQVKAYLQGTSGE